ncbi:MAG: hypothetical protein AAF387_11895 [Pseudomonadota bacterium]
MFMRSITKKCATAVFVALLSTTAATAQDAAIAADALSTDSGEDIGIQVARDAAELQGMLKRTPDVDVVDTALVFNNPRQHKTLVACVGYNANGRVMGRAYTVVPANGLRFIRAADISNGRDYLGSAKCKARARVIPSSFIVGIGFSDAPARVINGWDNSVMRFPVVASY